MNDLGLKAVMLNSMIDRTVEKVAEDRPDAADLAVWFDVIGIDSAYDYDPVWSACRDLGVSPTFHRGSRGRAFRMSPSNFCYNHIGHTSPPHRRPSAKRSSSAASPDVFRS